MASANYFLFFTIIFQIGTLVLSAKEFWNSEDVDHLGIGGNSGLTIVTNPNYRNNLNSLLSDLISESSLGFFNTSAGEVRDRAYGFYLCRGDLSAKKCNNCLKDIRQYILDQRIFYHYSNDFVFNMDLRCVLHYENSSTPFAYRQNTSNTGTGFGDELVHNQQYNTTLMNTMQELVKEAESGNWTKTNFATRAVDVVGTHEKIYILVQCRPDISAMNCSNCLNVLSRWPPATIRRQFLNFNCFLKYNDQSFFGSGYGSFMPSWFHIVSVLLLTMYVTFM